MKKIILFGLLMLMLVPMVNGVLQSLTPSEDVFITEIPISANPAIGLIKFSFVDQNIGDIEVINVTFTKSGDSYNFTTNSINISRWENGTWNSTTTPSDFDNLNVDFFNRTTLVPLDCDLTSVNIGEMCTFNITDIFNGWKNSGSSSRNIGNFTISLEVPDASPSYTGFDTIADTDPMTIGNRTLPQPASAIRFNTSNTTGGIPQLNYNIITLFNITSPINNSEWGDGVAIHINYTNLTTKSANVSYSLDGADYINIANESLIANLSIGEVSTGTHQLLINFTNSTDATESQTHHSQFFVGNVIDFCSDLTKLAFNLTFYDEENESLKLSNVDHGITLLTDNSTFNISQGGITEEINICVNGNNTGFNANVILEMNNESGGFYQKRTYLDIFTYDGSTANKIFLYLLQQNLSTEIQITVQDENAIPLKDHYVQARRFDANNNSFRVVDSMITENNGKGTVNININEVLYVFRVLKNDGTEVFQTINNNVVDDFIIKVIGGVEKTAEILDTIKNFLSYTLLVNTTSNIVNLTWDDATTNLISQSCLRIEQLNTSGVNVISENCTTDETGQLTFNYTGNNQSDLRAIFVVNSTQDNNVYDVAEEIIQNFLDFTLWEGNEGMITLIVVGTLYGLGIATGSGVFAAVFGLFGLFGVWLVGLIPISSFAFWGIFSVIILILIMRRNVN